VRLAVPFACPREQQSRSPSVRPGRSDDAHERSPNWGTGDNDPAWSQRDVARRDGLERVVPFFRAGPKRSGVQVSARDASRQRRLTDVLPLRRVRSREGPCFSVVSLWSVLLGPTQPPGSSRIVELMERSRLRTGSAACRCLTSRRSRVRATLRPLGESLRVRGAFVVPGLSAWRQDALRSGLWSGPEAPLGRLLKVEHNRCEACGSSNRGGVARPRPGSGSRCGGRRPANAA
jgi:hypothetical protein